MKTTTKMPITILLGFVISFILMYFPKQLLKDFTPLGVLFTWIAVVISLGILYNTEEE